MTPMSFFLRLGLLVARRVFARQQCAAIEQRSVCDQGKADVQTWTSTRPCAKRKKGALEFLHGVKLSGDTESCCDLMQKHSLMVIFKLSIHRSQ